ncbi:AMP-binding protein [Jonesia quinghaiensis]|uniref:AMP-binding protein n=1 Tax=Jonesia quinghaiensis TaxID=262806 RepID=UPI000688174E|nr:AMP-binding protein [Jonesia quinghaiensis]
MTSRPETRISPAPPHAYSIKDIDQFLDDLQSAPRLTVPTSGSTGTPLLVALSAQALLASVTATATRLGGHGQWVLALPTTHIAGVQVLARSAVAGYSPISVPREPRFTAEAFITSTHQLNAPRTYTALVPTQLHKLLNPPDPALANETIAALRSFDAILLGGAAAPPALLEQAATQGITLKTTYGMSETAGGCVYDGIPLDGVTIRISPTGRIMIAGPMLADGYQHAPTATAESFYWESDTRWHVTRDLGTLTNGQLTVHGRADDIIITGGVNVAPAAVEHALTGNFGIGEACVIGLPDPRWGQRVVAVVTAASAHSEIAQRDIIRAQITRYLGKAHAPQDILLVPNLPVGTTGKVSRALVTELATHLLSGNTP